MYPSQCTPLNVLLLVHSGQHIACNILFIYTTMISPKQVRTAIGEGEVPNGLNVVLEHSDREEVPGGQNTVPRTNVLPARGVMLELR